MQQREPSGDYGYDLAHDDVRSGQRPEPGARPEDAAPVARSRRPEPTGDLEYDEAHDF